MTTMTPELRTAIEQAGDEPARIIDTTTNTTYLLVKEQDFLVLPIDWSGEISAEERSRQMWESMKGDWDDPSMDIYDTEEYA